MILAWLTAKGFLGFKNWKWVAVVLAFAFAATSYSLWLDNKLDNARTQGELGAVNAGHETTLKQLEKANEAERNFTSAGSGGDIARYCSCRMSASSPTLGNCVRYLPEQLVSRGQAVDSVSCSGSGGE